jgi:glycosyltransferase involved in cell wall biosynthesis
MTSTICLNMIVKNEAKVIRRCLESMRSFIDTWVIVDTGSIDGTQNLIKTILSDIPGELYERTWVNFGHNRTEAVRLAEGKADYILLCDADNALVVNDADWKDKLVADAYQLPIRFGHYSFHTVRVLNARVEGDKRWRYLGATHEYIDCVRPGMTYSKETADFIEFKDYADGGSKSDKYVRDAALLEQELKTGEDLERQLALSTARTDLPDALAEQGVLLTRTVFYLAQTYRDMGENAKSLKMYARRATMGGWDEEVWYSLLEVANLSARLELAHEVVIRRYLEAYQTRPQRAEPLVQLARIFREKKQYALAHLFASKAKEIRRPDDILFLDTTTYDWRALDEYAVASYWIGEFRECAKACENLLSNPALPHNQLARVTENLNFALEKLGKRVPSR